MCNKFLLFSLLIGFSFANIMSIANYSVLPLDNLRTYNLGVEENGVTLKYKVFSESECKKYLGREEFMEKGFVPIQIQIFNNTDKCLNLSTKNFSFPCVPFKKVVKKVKFKTIKRVFDWGLLGAILSLSSFPYIANGIAFGTITPQFVPIYIGLLFLPAVIECVKSPRANKYLYDDYCSKALIDQEIEPGSSANGVVFVSKKHFDILKNYLNFNFYLILNDVASNEQFKLSTNN